MSLATADTCPKCEGTLLGNPIPEADRHYYAAGATHFRLVIGVEYEYGEPEHYDGVSEWRCPHCGYREGRWSGRELAEGDVERRFGR